MPPVSLILPLLRQRDEWLRQAVLSALQQTVECEVILVTSPAMPESNRMVLGELQAEYPKLRIIERPAGMRFAGALNLGIRSSAAARIGFVLTDDWLDPRAVEICLQHDTDIVSTGLQAWKEDGKTRLRHITTDWSRAEYDRRPTLAEKAHYLSYFFLYRRTTLEAVGGLDETLGDSPGIDDWDLPWSLLEHGASVMIVEQRLYNCRDHEGERLTTRNQDAMMATFLRLLDKHCVTGELRERLIRQNVPSFGLSLQTAYNRSAPWPVRRLREIYRTTLPIQTRRTIQDRAIDPVLNRLRFRKQAEDHPEICLCVAIPHVERPQNYLLQTVRGLLGSATLGQTKVAICDFSAEPSTNLHVVAQEFESFINSGQLIIERFTGERPTLEGLVRNFGDNEERVKWRSRQVLDAAWMMEHFGALAPFYVHLEDDMVASSGCLKAVRGMIHDAPPDWFSMKLSPLGACAIAFQSAGLPQLAAYLRLMYCEMPLDWLIDEHIAFRKRIGQSSTVRKELFEHIGVHSSLPGQVR